MKMQQINNFVGDAGELLVLSHLKSRRIEAGIVNGDDTDLVALIGGQWRTFQIKSSNSRYFSKGGPQVQGGPKQKKFSEYDVDAFAFVFLPDPYPYYIAIEGMTDNLSLPPNAFSRGARDMSFAELLRRWGVVEFEFEGDVLQLDGFAPA